MCNLTQLTKIMLIETVYYSQVKELANSLKTGAPTEDCDCDEEAGVAVFVDSEKPVKELVVPEEVDVLLIMPKPVKELELEPELAGADAEDVTAAEEKLTPIAGNVAVVVVAGVAVLAAEEVEAVVVVTVENNGAEGVAPKDSEVAFAEGVLEILAVEEAAVALLKLNEG